jgi:alpha amylase-like protein
VPTSIVLAEQGFDWIWFLSVWQTGLAGQRISRTNVEWQHEFEETLPDLREQDIAGSGFAITGYIVHDHLGGDAALGRLRERLRVRGLRLLLDFVPNHTGPDHPWVEQHPEYYVQGTEADQTRAPQNYTRVKRSDGDCVLAYGRDPYFSGRPDTLQLNYGNPATQDAMTAELVKIAGQCDGVRCDMAMLVLPDVFERTWNIRAQPFWPDATRRVRGHVDVRAGDAPGGGSHYVPVAWSSLLPSRTIRRTTEAHLAASGSRPARGSRSAAAAVLRSSARRAATDGCPRGPVAVDRMRTCLGRKLDLGLLCGLSWQGPNDKRLLVAVNYAPNQSQCFVRLPFTDLDGRQWRLEDPIQGTVYDRHGCDLQRSGLYLDVRPWQASVFTLNRIPSES